MKQYNLKQLKNLMSLAKEYNLQSIKLGDNTIELLFHQDFKVQDEPFDIQQEEKKIEDKKLQELQELLYSSRH